jgi:hypothetical protein
MLRDTYWLKDNKLPPEWLKNQHSICLFKNLTGHECYGCGMTRAILSGIHLQFVNAFHYNKLFIIVLPLLVYIWSKTLIISWTGRAFPLNLLWKKKLLKTNDFSKAIQIDHLSQKYFYAKKYSSGK